MKNIKSKASLTILAAVIIGVFLLSSFFSYFLCFKSSKQVLLLRWDLKGISSENEHDIWYYDFIESDKEIDLDVDTDEASYGVLTIFNNYRIEDFDGSLLGVVGVGVKLEEIASMLMGKQTKYKRDIYLVDENGIVQVHTDLNLIESFFEARKSLYISLIITILLAALLYFFSYKTLKGFENTMELIAGTDNLTNTYNRRELIIQFELFKYRNVRYSSSVCLILLDIDNFKVINDKFGHLMGDNVLKAIADNIRATIRPIDLLTRWGGDEFILVMEASLEEASAMAKRIRSSSYHLSTEKIEKVSQDITVSLGVAQCNNDDTLNSLIKRADKALYTSKEKGKNCVTIATSIK